MITSPSNQRVKDTVRLRQRRNRDRSGLFLIEGSRELTRAVEAGIEMSVLFVCAELLSDQELVGGAEKASSERVDVSRAVFEKLSYRDSPQGLLAVAKQFSVDLNTLVLGETALVLVAEAIEKPGNLGTMLRSAAAAGIDGLIVADPRTDVFNPNVVRASLGHLFTVPLAVAESAVISEWLRKAGVKTVSLTPDAQVSLYDVDLSGPSALVIGAEQSGLSQVWLDNADSRAVIPMPGHADSLNASTAAAVAMFEARRQRG